MRCLTAHRGDVCLPVRRPETTSPNPASPTRKLRSFATSIPPIPLCSPRSEPDFHHARHKPIPISLQRLPASSCIGNAPAIRLYLLLPLHLAGALPIQPS